MRALVTGASGFIGGAVARTLLAKGVRVRVLLRPGTVANLPDRGAVEPVFGDLRDAGAVRAAAEGCAAIFHAGGLYSFEASAAELRATNVGGTRHVLDAARAVGARLVHTSSICTIGGMRGGGMRGGGMRGGGMRGGGMRGGGMPDEHHEASGRAPGAYHESKCRAERLVREEARRGVDAVIVNPTFPVGWGDVKPTPTGAVIRDFLAGRIPAYLDTGMNVVDVDDVAEGHWLAFERGRRGERYILGHANVMMRELLEHLAQLSGRTPPRVRLPYAVALGLALAGARSVPLEAVRTAREIRFATSARAVRELGFPQTPLRTALEKAVRWFLQARLPAGAR